MQRRNALVVLAIALLLTQSACASATPEPTASPIPTPTATPIPLSQIDLEALLIRNGDLPAGFSGAQVLVSLTEMYNDLPQAENSIQRELAGDCEQAGFVTVLLFESRAGANAAYEKVVGGFRKPVDEGPRRRVRRGTVSDVGEQAQSVTLEVELVGKSHFVRFTERDLAFVRCLAVAHIRMRDTSSLVGIESYAKRLDERLASVACP